MDIRVEQAVREVADEAKVPFANLMAVVEVESNGVVFAKVDGTNEPLIRWEGHYFYKALTGAKRDAAVRQGLASPKAQAVKNPSSQQGRWDKLLKPGMGIDRAAAMESCSWGVGQVMGSHWKRLGFKSVEELATLARSGAKGQVLLMMRYCQVFGLMDELKSGDFKGFARGYNGPNYKKFKYDTKMATAARRYGGEQPFVPPASADMLSIGSKGSKVREAQELLTRAGQVVDVDGDFGPATKRATEEFQKANKLKVDGKIGPETWRVLSSWRQDGEERPGAVSVTESAVQTEEGRQGGATFIGSATATATVNTAKEQLEPLTGSSGTIDLIFTLLTIAGVCLALAGIAWMAWGWIKVNRSHAS